MAQEACRQFAACKMAWQSTQLQTHMERDVQATSSPCWDPVLAHWGCSQQKKHDTQTLVTVAPPWHQCFYRALPQNLNGRYVK
jgi:hypothetical protein